MKSPIEVLQDSGYKVYYSNTSALDHYFRIPSGSSAYLLTDCSLISLAGLFEELEYPGLVYEEALVRRGKKRYLLRCCRARCRSAAEPNCGLEPSRRRRTHTPRRIRAASSGLACCSDTNSP